MQIKCPSAVQRSAAAEAKSAKSRAEDLEPSIARAGRPFAEGERDLRKPANGTHHLNPHNGRASKAKRTRPPTPPLRLPAAHLHSSPPSPSTTTVIQSNRLPTPYASI